MVLNKYRSNVDPLMRPIAKKMEKVDPNLISWIAIVCAAVAGYMFIAAWDYDYDLILLAFVFIILNAVLDALDGYIARLTGKASRLGDFLDHVLDRYADAFIFGGIAISGFCHTPVGIIAIFGVFFTSYMGTQGQAIGLTRNYGGMLGRADRLALLLFFTLAQWIYIAVTDDLYLVTLDVFGTDYPLTILEVFMIIVAIFGNITAIQRGTAAWKDLRRMEEEGLLDDPEHPQGLVTVESDDEDRSDGSADAEADDEDDQDDDEDTDEDATEDGEKALEVKVAEVVKKDD